MSAPRSRFNWSNPVLFAAYFPVGCALVALRICVGMGVWLLGALLSDARPLTPAMRVVFGVRVSGRGDRDDGCELMVANRLSMLDALALDAVVGCVTAVRRDADASLSAALGEANVGPHEDRERFRQAVRKRCGNSQNRPICVQPEGCPTDGNAVLKFQEWPFTLYNRVQPVALRAERPFGKVTVVSDAHWKADGISRADAFWFLWNPYTVYHVRLLPTVERLETESCAEFARRTQTSIAESLKVEASDVTGERLREFVSARDAERNRSFTPPMDRARGRVAPTSGLRPDLQRMAAQVKEILPTVPLSVITKDLSRTRNVDVTLTNILEGAVPYTPEDAAIFHGETTGTAGPSEPAPATSSSSSTTTCSSVPLRTAAATFPRNAHERQSSYQERKAQLIEAARRRYIEKHGLKNC